MLRQGIISKLIRFYLIGLILGFCQNTHAEITVDATSALFQLTKNKQEVAIHAQILPPEDSEQTLEEVMLRDDWQAQDKRVISLGSLEHEVWFRLNFTPIYSEKWAVVLTYLTLDYVDFYWTQDGTLLKHDVSGDRRKYSERKSQIREISSSLYIEKDEKVTLYIKVKSEGPILLPIHIKDENTIVEEVSKLDLYLGMYYGLLLVMAMYNLILFFITRLNSYLYYVLYIFFSIFSRAPIDGPGFQYLWPENPDFNIWMLPVMFWLAAISYLVFTFSFLNIQRSRFFGKLMFYLAFAWMGLLALYYPFTSYQVIVPLLTLTSSLLLIMGFIYAVIKSLSGRLHAAVFASAIFFSMIAYIINALGIYGYIENPDLAIYGYPIGRTIEIVLFAVALGIRIRHIGRRRELAEEEILKSNESAIKNLEQYERLYETSLVGNAVLTENGDIQSANKAFYRELSGNDSENVKSSIYDYFPRERVFPLIEKIHGQQNSIEEEIKSENGSWFTFMLHKVDQYKGHEYECSIIDVTDRRRAAELKEQSQVDKMNSLQHLVVGVSHEINTPLGIVGTSLDHTGEILHQVKDSMANGSLTKTQFEQDLSHGKGAIDLAIENVIRLKNMIDSFKQVSVQQMSFVDGEIDLRELVADQSDVAEQLGVHSSSQVDSVKGVIFNSYPKALSWILKELTLNTAEHGVNESKTLDQLKIKLKIEQRSNELEIIFKDNGGGLNDVVLENIIDPFVTSKRGASQKLGLGLYQVYNLVQQLLKGRLEITEDNGLIVKMVIPNLKLTQLIDD